MNMDTARLQELLTCAERVQRALEQWNATPGNPSLPDTLIPESAQVAALARDLLEDLGPVDGYQNLLDHFLFRQAPL